MLSDILSYVLETLVICMHYIVVGISSSDTYICSYSVIADIYGDLTSWLPSFKRKNSIHELNQYILDVRRDLEFATVMSKNLFYYSHLIMQTCNLCTSICVQNGYPD